MDSEYDLYEELKEKTKQLDTLVSDSKKLGRKRAQKEKEYKILLRQECLKLREKDMAIGMIEKTCYGIPEVADARFARDIADVLYTANQEAINSVKLELRLIENQIQREWSTS